jgi:hypothetical protein
MALRARALSPRQLDHARVRADEADVARGTHLGQVGALGQEPVSRVDGVSAGDFRRTDDRRDVQVAVGAARRADAHVLVGEPDVQRVLVGLGVDGDGLDAQLAAGHDDSQGDFATVGDENLLNITAMLRLRRLSRRRAARRTERPVRSRRTP